MKIYDAASRDKFTISTSHGDLDYAHVIDEMLDELIGECGDGNISMTKSELEEGVSIENFSSVLSSFSVHKELNDRVWSGENMLNPRVRARLLDIADEFINSLNVSWVKPSDIVLMGSLANYNWSKYSDFDLHILMDFKKVDKRTDFVTEYFDAKKTLWNDQHENLKIYGFPVEVYVQDVNADYNSSGVYSLQKNRWVYEPDYDDMTSVKLNKATIRNKSLKYIKQIDDLCNKFEGEKDAHKIEIISNKVKKLWDTLKGIRKNALKNGNEMSIGNLIWKCLRRLNYIEKLMDLKYKSYDKINSIK